MDGIEIETPEAADHEGLDHLNESPAAPEPAPSHDPESEPVGPVIPSQARRVKVKKARGGEGVNRSLDCYVKVGDEFEVDVDMAARCVMGKEFDLVDDADRPAVDEAIRELQSV